MKTNKIQFSSDSYILDQDRVREKYIHDLIISNEGIRNDIVSILGIENQSIELIHEDRYINGIIADFTILANKKIRAIMECKAGDIGVTDYVRGIGQVMQYEYFWEQKVSNKGYEYGEVFNSILLFPSSILKNNLMNIGRFKYPTTTILIEVNDINKVSRSVSVGELEKIGKSIENNLTAISQYYVRDNRLYEIFMLLKYIAFLSLKGVKKINRKELEISFLQQLKTPNNKNWRNAFISLSSFGFTDSDNNISPAGFRFGYIEYSDFLFMMYESYIKPYIDTLLEYFKLDSANLKKPNQKICAEIKESNSGKDILFLTDSGGRYMSSWLNILRDDFGCISFESRNSNREIIYDISELNKKTAIEYIRKYTQANKYLDNLNLIIK